MFLKLIRGSVVVLFLLFSVGVRADVSIPFELINGLIVVEAEIDGEIGNFIVDSGSNGILLNGNNTSSKISYETLDGNIEGSEKRISSLKLGSFEQKELRGFTTDLSSIEVYIQKEINGILGFAVFTPNSLIFDFLDSKFTISESRIDPSFVEDCSQLSYSIIEDLPIAKLSINGELHNFILDSGASAHFIDYSIINELASDAIETGRSRNIVTAAGNGSLSKEYEIKSIKIGESRLKFSAFEKEFTVLSEELDLKISGLLSLNKLASQKFYFDVNSKKLYF